MRPSTRALCLAAACLLAAAVAAAAQQGLSADIKVSALDALSRAPLARSARVAAAAKAVAANSTAYEREHAALLAIKASMPALDSTVWAFLRWDADTNHCTSWANVVCMPQGDPAGRVISLDLYGAQLYGQVPWVQVSELSALLILNLGGNPGFQNATPPNTFDASLPSKLPQLSDFWINDAGIEGRMPDSWADWPLMRRLALHNNKLGGTLDDIPWARFKALQAMILINTGLTGPLSPAVAAAGKTLQRLYLGSNALTGDLTPAIRALNGSALRLLDIDSNNLDSVIPTEIGGMQALQQIYATLAGLKGALPESLGSLRSLNLLLLSGNKLEGPIPASFANLTQMEKLYLSYNALSGPIATICRLPALTEMLLGANRFSGPLCSQLPPKLNFAGFEINQFSGTLPAAWGSALALRQLWLRDNRLSGGLPDAWAPMVRNLGLFFLDTNCLRGPVPCSWSGLSAGLYGFAQGAFQICRNPVSEEVCGPSGATVYSCLPFVGSELLPIPRTDGQLPDPVPGRENYVSVTCSTRTSSNINLTFIPYNTGTGLTGFCGAPAFSMPTSSAAANASMVCASQANPSNCTGSPLTGTYAKGPASGVMSTPQNNTKFGVCEAGTSMGAYEVACSSDAGLSFNLTIVNAQMINRIRFYAGCTPPVDPAAGRAACSQWRPLPADYKRARGSNSTFDSITWSSALPVGCSCADAYNAIYIRSGTTCRA